MSDDRSERAKALDDAIDAKVQAILEAANFEIQQRAASQRDATPMKGPRIEALVRAILWSITEGDG